MVRYRELHYFYGMYKHIHLMPVVLGGLLQRVLKIAKQMIHLECQMLSQPLWCIVPRVCVYLIKHFYFLYFSLSLSLFPTGACCAVEAAECPAMTFYLHAKILAQFEQTEFSKVRLICYMTTFLMKNLSSWSLLTIQVTLISKTKPKKAKPATGNNSLNCFQRISISLFSLS